MPLRHLCRHKGWHLCRATCVLCKLSVVTCAVVPLQIICAVQSGVFECCATDHFYRQKLLPTETCAAVLVHCADKVHFRMYRQKQSRTYTRRATNCTLYKHKTPHKPAAQVSGTSQLHKERHKKIDRHGNIVCILCHCGTCAAGGGA